MHKYKREGEGEEVGQIEKSDGPYYYKIKNGPIYIDGPKSKQLLTANKMNIYI